MKKIVVIGSLNIDFVVDVAEMPRVGETLLAEEFHLIPGGKGANQACAVAKLGGEVTMLGAIGQDMYGDLLVNSLKKAGVCVEHLNRLEQVSTGIALITVNQAGNNSIIVIQGANKKVDCAYIDRNMDVIRACDIVIFQLEIPLDTVEYAAKKAKELGKTVILDPAPAQRDLPDTLLQNVDIIKPNETELMTLIGAENLDNLDQATAVLHRRGAEQVVVTLGGDGAYLAPKGRKGTRFYADQSVKVVDTTAAGDSFTAALSVSLAKGEPIEDAIQLAMNVADIVITRKGAQSSIPTMEEVSARFG